MPALAEAVRARGGTAVLIRRGSSFQETGPDLYETDLCDLSAVTAFANHVHSRYSLVAGLVHLLPLHGWSGPGDMDLVEWQNQIDGADQIPLLTSPPLLS